MSSIYQEYTFTSRFRHIFQYSSYQSFTTSYSLLIGNTVSTHGGLRDRIYVTVTLCVAPDGNPVCVRLFESKVQILTVANEIACGDTCAFSFP